MRSEDRIAFELLMVRGHPLLWRDFKETFSISGVPRKSLTAFSFRRAIERKLSEEPLVKLDIEGMDAWDLKSVFAVISLARRVDPDILDRMKFIGGGEKEISDAKALLRNGEIEASAFFIPLSKNCLNTELKKEDREKFEKEKTTKRLHLGDSRVPLYRWPGKHFKETIRETIEIRSDIRVLEGFENDEVYKIGMDEEEEAHEIEEDMEWSVVMD